MTIVVTSSVVFILAVVVIAFAILIGSRPSSISNCERVDAFKESKWLKSITQLHATAKDKDVDSAARRNNNNELQCMLKSVLLLIT